MGWWGRGGISENRCIIMSVHNIIMCGAGACVHITYHFAQLYIIGLCIILIHYVPPVCIQM